MATKTTTPSLLQRQIAADKELHKALREIGAQRERAATAEAAAKHEKQNADQLREQLFADIRQVKQDLQELKTAMGQPGADLESLKVACEAINTDIGRVFGQLEVIRTLGGPLEKLEEVINKLIGLVAEMQQENDKMHREMLLLADGHTQSFAELKRGQAQLGGKMDAAAERVEAALREIRTTKYSPKPVPTPEPDSVPHTGSQKPVEEPTSAPVTEPQRSQPVAAEPELRAERRTEPVEEPQGFFARARRHSTVGRAVVAGLALALVLGVAASRYGWSPLSWSWEPVQQTQTTSQPAPAKDGQETPPKPAVIADNCPLCVVNAEGFRSVTKAVEDGAQLIATVIQTSSAATQPAPAQTTPAPEQEPTGPYLEKTEEEWQVLSPKDKYARLVNHCKGTYKVWGGLTPEEKEQLILSIYWKRITLTVAKQIIDGCNPQILLAQKELWAPTENCRPIRGYPGARYCG